MPSNFSIWCALGGELSFPHPHQRDDVLAFLDRAAAAGATKLFASVTIRNQAPRYRDFVTPANGGQVRTFRDYYKGLGWDPAEFLVVEAHRRGVQVHLYWGIGWHGGVAIPSDPDLHPLVLADQWASDHPAYWRRVRDGRNSFDWVGRIGLSPGYPEARAYEQSLILELARAYAIDGFQLEYELEALPRQIDERGVSVYGYEEPIVQAFREQSGLDPFQLDNADQLWLRFRAGYTDLFIAELRAEIGKLGRPFELSAAVAANPTRGLPRLQDWPTWVERGLVDSIYIRHLHRDLVQIENDTRAARDAIRGRLPLIAQLGCWNTNKLITAPLLEAGVTAARDGGADEIGIYRADAITQWGLWGAVTTIGRACRHESPK